jgi:hypothetical protein
MLISEISNCAQEIILVVAFRVIDSVLCKAHHPSSLGRALYFSIIFQLMLFLSQFAGENDILYSRILVLTISRGTTVMRKGTFLAFSSLTTIPSHF